MTYVAGLLSSSRPLHSVGTNDLEINGSFLCKSDHTVVSQKGMGYTAAPVSTDAGKYSVTLTQPVKEIKCITCQVEDSELTRTVQPISAVASTGVITFQLVGQDGSPAAVEAANTTYIHFRITVRMRGTDPV
jgi:hypothetical protein